MVLPTARRHEQQWRPFTGCGTQSKSSMATTAWSPASLREAAEHSGAGMDLKALPVGKTSDP